MVIIINTITVEDVSSVEDETHLSLPVFFFACITIVIFLPLQLLHIKVILRSLPLLLPPPNLFSFPPILSPSYPLSLLSSLPPILSPSYPLSLLSSLPPILILYPSLRLLCPLPPQDIRVSSPMGVRESEGSL
jgi:hypothetical protein